MPRFDELDVVTMSEGELNLRIAVAIGEIEVADDNDLWNYWNALPLWYRRVRRLIKGDPPGPYAPGVYCGAYCTDTDWNAWAVTTSGVTLPTGPTTLRERAVAVLIHLDSTLSES